MYFSKEEAEAVTKSRDTILFIRVSVADDEHCFPVPVSVEYFGFITWTVFEIILKTEIPKVAVRDFIDYWFGSLTTFNLWCNLYHNQQQVVKQERN